MSNSGVLSRASWSISCQTLPSEISLVGGFKKTRNLSSVIPAKRTGALAVTIVHIVGELAERVKPEQVGLRHAGDLAIDECFGNIECWFET